LQLVSLSLVNTTTVSPLTLTQLYYLLVSSVHLSTDVKINPLILSKNVKFYVKWQAVINQRCSRSWKAAPPQLWLSVWHASLWWWLHMLRAYHRKFLWFGMISNQNHKILNQIKSHVL